MLEVNFLRKSIVFRIMGLYILILLISITSTVVMYSNTASQYLRRQAQYILDRDQKILTDFLSKSANRQVELTDITVSSQYKRFFVDRINRNINNVSSQYVFYTKSILELYFSSDDPENVDFYKSKLKENVIVNVPSKTVVNISKFINDSEYNIRIVPLTKKMSSDLVGGYMVLYIQSAPVNDLTNDMQQAILVSFAVSLLLIIITGFLFAKRLSAPIIKLTKSAGLIAKRNFNTRVKISTKDELGALADSINKMASSLHEYDEAQKRFLQNSSHELKTPLMSIQGYAEGLKDGIFDKDSPALDIIIDESKRLKKIVDDLLLLSKLETLDDFYLFKSVSISRVIQEAVEKIHGAAVYDNKIIIVNQIPSGTIKCDEDKLIQVFINVLGNAIRYAKSEIVLSVKKEEKEFLIIISDDGPGFKSEDLENVFDRFYKGVKGVTGLGLSIAKAIVERHAGTIIAYNMKKGGACIEIRLPSK